ADPRGQSTRDPARAAARLAENQREVLAEAEKLGKILEAGDFPTLAKTFAPALEGMRAAAGRLDKGQTDAAVQAAQEEAVARLGDFRVAVIKARERLKNGE